MVRTPGFHPGSRGSTPLGDDILSIVIKKYIILFLTLSTLFGITIGCRTAAIEKKTLALKYYNIGNEYYKDMKFDKAIEFYNEAIRLNPDLLNAHFNLVLALIKDKRYQEADDFVINMLNEEPENTDFLKILGFSYFMQGKYDESLTIFDRILELNPKNLDASYNKALILWKQEKREEAKQMLMDILEISGNENNTIYNDTLYNLGQIYHEDNDWDNSIIYFTNIC